MRIYFFLFVFLLGTSPVQASSIFVGQALDDSYSLSDKRVQLSVDGGMTTSPAYEGSNQQAVYPFVAGQVLRRFKRDSLSASTNGIAYYRRGQTHGWGLGLPFDFGRTEKKANFFQYGSTKLRGMGTVSSTLEGSIYGWKTFFRVPFFLSLRQALTQGGHRGSVLEMGALADVVKIKNIWLLSTMLTVSFADKNYMNAYFGVNGEQAKHTAFTQYGLRRGYKGSYLDLYSEFRLNARCVIYQAFRTTWLSQAINDSPIVGNRLLATLYVGTNYTW